MNWRSFTKYDQNRGECRMDIQSTANPKVKQWMKLLGKKGRHEQGKFIVEGVTSVLSALEAKAEIDCIVYSGERGMPEELEGRCGSLITYSVSEAVLKKCTDAVTPQTVFAVVHQQRNAIDRLFADDSAPSLVIVCDNIQDPGNLGTIIRSADAAGASGVIVSPDSVDIFHPKVIRSTMGSIFHVPVMIANVVHALDEAAGRGIQLWTAQPQADVSLYEADLTQAVWFVIGNEAHGISASVIEKVNHSLSIPMQGRAESLNAAMAATVMLFETMRQRMNRNIS